MDVAGSEDGRASHARARARRPDDCHEIPSGDVVGADLSFSVAPDRQQVVRHLAPGMENGLHSLEHVGELRMRVVVGAATWVVPPSREFNSLKGGDSDLFEAKLPGCVAVHDFMRETGGRTTESNASARAAFLSRPGCRDLY